MSKGKNKQTQKPKKDKKKKNVVEALSFFGILCR